MLKHLRRLVTCALLAHAVLSLAVNDNVNYVCRELKYESLVLEGGGLKGLAYVGSLESLAKHGYFTNNIWQFKNISGTSIGCLFGYFIALDISPENLNRMVTQTNFSDLFSKNVKSLLDIPDKQATDSIMGKIKYFCKLLDYARKIFSIWYKNDAPGVSSGNEIIIWIMENVLKYSPYKHLISLNTTFREFEDITQHSLTCYATKLGDKPALMELNSKTAPSQKIINALYSSITLPIIFKPLVDNNGSTLVDGGLILNFPIYQQDWHGKKNSRVLGLSLHKRPKGDPIIDESKSFNFVTKTNQYSSIGTLDYLQKLVSVVTSLKSYILYSNDPRNCDRIIYLNPDIQILDIHVTRDKITKIINRAYNHTHKFLTTKAHTCYYKNHSSMFNSAF